jgi:hypothetical protein
MVREGQGMGSIIRETGANLSVFVLASFFNLVTFISKRYTTFAYVILGFFFNINVEKHKKKTSKTSCKIVIVLMYSRNFDS